MEVDHAEAPAPDQRPADHRGAEDRDDVGLLALHQRQDRGMVDVRHAHAELGAIEGGSSLSEEEAGLGWGPGRRMSAASGACAPGARGAAPCARGAMTRGVAPGPRRPRRRRGRGGWPRTGAATPGRRGSPPSASGAGSRRADHGRHAQRLRAQVEVLHDRGATRATEPAPERGERARRSSASAMARASPGGASRPERPCSTSSGMPEMRLATTGRPQLIASISVTGMPSRRPARSWTLAQDQDVRRRACARATTSRASGPCKWTWRSSRRRRRARGCSRSSGPPPDEMAAEGHAALAAAACRPRSGARAP